MAEQHIEDVLTATSGKWMDVTDCASEFLLTVVVPSGGGAKLQISEEKILPTKARIRDVETYTAGTWHRAIPPGPRYIRVTNTGAGTVILEWGMGRNANGEAFPIIPQGQPSTTSSDFSA